MLDSDVDLRFQPVQNARPKRLGLDNIANYNALGFLQRIDALSSSEIAEIRAYIDGLMKAMGPVGAYGINCYQARLSGLYDIATDARILDFVEDLVGPNILCWASAILCKSPHDPKAVPWHQDAGFGRYRLRAQSQFGWRLTTRMRAIQP